MRTLFLLLAFGAAASASAQQMYRCRTPDGKVAFQDQPCAPGAAQTAVAPPATAAVDSGRVRPVEGMSPEQKRDYDALYRGYIEVFRIAGRAKTCAVPDAEERLRALIERLKQRHRDNDPAFYAITMGYTAGAENRAVEEIGETKPPAPVRCELVADLLHRATLPAIPASIYERGDEPVDVVRHEGRTPGGSYRFLSRKLPARGAPEQLLVYRERIVFRSAEPFDDRFDAVWGGPTPVVFFATLNAARKCADGRPYRTWHAVSLPASGVSVSTRIDADCMQLWTNKDGLCAGQDRGSARLYRISDTGEVTLAGERPPGECPRR